MNMEDSYLSMLHGNPFAQYNYYCMFVWMLTFQLHLQDQALLNL